MNHSSIVVLCSFNMRHVVKNKLKKFSFKNAFFRVLWMRSVEDKFLFSQFFPFSRVREDVTKQPLKLNLIKKSIISMRWSLQVAILHLIGYELSALYFSDQDILTILPIHFPHFLSICQNWDNFLLFSSISKLHMRRCL